MENKNLELLVVEYDFKNLPQDVISKTFNFSYALNQVVKDNLSSEQMEELNKALDSVMDYVAIGLMTGFAKLTKEELDKDEQ